MKQPANIELRNRYWYTSLSSSTGGLAVLQKYGRIGGDPEYRRQRWYEWWEQKGKYTYPWLFRRISVRKASRSCRLAEFVGIMLGDGGISPRQLTITLHKEDDKEYGTFVVSLIEELFDVSASVRPSPKEAATNYVISRTELVHFCVNNVGLKQGDKIRQQVDVPKWIKRDRQYMIACVRGLIDTDGCVFTHQYSVRKKQYKYKKLGFSSRSKPLLVFVFSALKRFGLHPRYAGDHEVRLDRIADVKHYFEIIGTHNPKHLKRFKK